MVPGVLMLLVLVAFGLTLLSAYNPPKIHQWVPIFVICLILLLMVWPK
jgi:hypothetical protein